MSIAAPQRFSKTNPCPICGGGDNMARGNGVRCSGFLSDDGAYAHCTRSEHAGQLEPTSAEPPTFGHRLEGDCRCGVQHAPASRPWANGHGDVRRIAHAYDYLDETGQLLYQVVRFEPKRFLQRRPDGNGGWVWNLDGTRRVLYRLANLFNEVKLGATVYFAEGEKDVDAIVDAGQSATCSVGGAGKWRDEYATPLAAAKAVRVIADRDEQGRAHAQTVAASLRAAGVSDVEILEPAVGKDVADHLAAGRTLAELEPVQTDDPPAEVLPDGPVFTDLRDIEVREIDWHDEPYLPRGELVTNNADGGTGKGLLSVHYGTRMSRGEFGGTPQMVVFAVAEDAYETILKPRLLAAGADLAYIRGLDWHRRGMKDAVVIPDDIPRLEQSIREMRVGLLVIDPLLSHISSKTNSHVDHEVKVALKPLVALAQRTGCTVLGNGHFGKDKTRGAVGSAQGSNAFTNTPRVALGMAPDDDDPDVRILEVIKSNLGAKGTGRNYRITTTDVDGLGKPVPLIVPEGAATKRIDTLLLAKKDDKRVPAELVQSIVLRELAHGEQTRQHLDETAEAETGAKPDSVYKSALTPLRERGQIKARKDGMVGGWFWRLANSDVHPTSKMDVEDG